MTFKLEDTNGRDLGFGLPNESSAFDFARLRTTASGRPVWVQRFLTDAAGELVPVGAPVQIGVDREAEAAAEAAAAEAAEAEEQ